MRILLVEDDDRLAAVLAAGLRDQGIDVTRAASAAGGEERLVFGTYDVLVFDVGLPDGDGFVLTAEARRRGLDTPVLILTARDALDDRVRGLELGADDYLVKPFAFRELLARVRALARRRPHVAPAVHRVSDLTVDLATREVVRAGRPITLTAKEFALLESFVQHAGVVLDRATITAHVWDDNHDPFSNALEVLIGRLRRKIDDGRSQALIHTARGAGYRFGP